LNSGNSDFFFQILFLKFTKNTNLFNNDDVTCLEGELIEGRVSIVVPLGKAVGLPSGRQSTSGGLLWLLSRMRERKKGEEGEKRKEEEEGAGREKEGGRGRREGSPS
jgi:hypothetical protein